MEGKRKVFVIFLSILLGIISGFASYHSYGVLFGFYPGIYFGVGVCLVLKFLLKAKINIAVCIIFIIGSALSYYIAEHIVSVAEEVHPDAWRVAFAGLVGGLGISISFAIFNYKLLSENVALIIVSVISSLTLIVDSSIGIFHDEVLLLFIIWQGAMMGSLAYFTLKKLQEENNNPKNQVNTNIT